MLSSQGRPVRPGARPHGRAPTSYLTKPFTKEGLVAAVNEYVKTRPSVAFRERQHMAIKKILVVDDSPTERQFLTDLLAKNGFEVVAPPRTARTRSQGRSRRGPT